MHASVDKMSDGNRQHNKNTRSSNWNEYLAHY
jgi:hypothetical protein